MHNLNMQIKIMIIKNIYAMSAFTRFAGSIYGKPRGFNVKLRDPFCMNDRLCPVFNRGCSRSGPCVS